MILMNVIFSWRMMEFESRHPGKNINFLNHILGCFFYLKNNL